jgi:hypothetical protein
LLNPLRYILPIGAAGTPLRGPEQAKNFCSGLPGPVDMTQEYTVPTPWIPIQLVKRGHHPGPEGIEVEISDQFEKI